MEWMLLCEWYHHNYLPNENELIMFWTVYSFCSVSSLFEYNVYGFKRKKECVARQQNTTNNNAHWKCVCFLFNFPFVFHQNIKKKIVKINKWKIPCVNSSSPISFLFIFFFHCFFFVFFCCFPPSFLHFPSFMTKPWVHWVARNARLSVTQRYWKMYKKMKENGNTPFDYNNLLTSILFPSLLFGFHMLSNHN